MKEKNIIYYLIRERILAKREQSAEIYEDSPYRFGNTSVMMEIDEISEEKAKEIMNQYM